MPPGSIPNRATRSRSLGVALAVFAAASTIGAGVASAARDAYRGGGIGTPSAPVVRDVQCIDRCLSTRQVTETGRAAVTGKHLGSVERVKLSGVEMKVKSADADSVEFVVPEGTKTGKPKVFDPYGNSAKSPVELQVAPADRLDQVQGFEVRQAEAVNRKAFFKSKRSGKLEYLFEAEEPTDIRIDVLRGKNGKVVDSIVQKDQDPFQSHTAKWSGLTEKGKVAKSSKKYKFAISQVSGGDRAKTGFGYFDHIFPLKGRHTYGDGLGAGRNHQGQDVFAKCGNKIVAARGGRVQTSAYHGSAGDYIVIDGAKTGIDYAYMHLEKRGRAKKGSRVKTGEVIGYNSDTGNASGCHLHFEMWSAPGWYEGGSPMSPTRPLKKWDSWS